MNKTHRKILNTLKHKLGIIAENYNSVDAHGAYHSDAKGLFFKVRLNRAAGIRWCLGRSADGITEKMFAPDEKDTMYRVLDLVHLLWEVTLDRGVQLLLKVVKFGR